MLRESLLIASFLAISTIVICLFVLIWTGQQYSDLIFKLITSSVLVLLVERIITQSINSD